MTAQLFEFPAPQPKKPAKKGYPADFEEFWLGFPRKLNCSKLMAAKAWEKLDLDERIHALSVLPVFIRFCRGKEEQFICHPTTWLNQKRFESMAPPSTPTRATPLTVDWTSVMRLYNMTSNWKADLYGPAPGHPACRVPQEYLEMM